MKLNQWKVTVDGISDAVYVFTPSTCDIETAMAVAVATIGPTVTAIEDEGIIRQALTSEQLHIADSRNCPECGQFKVHEEDCPAESRAEHIRIAAKGGCS